VTSVYGNQDGNPTQRKDVQTKQRTAKTFVLQPDISWRARRSLAIKDKSQSWCGDMKNHILCFLAVSPPFQKKERMGHGVV
jgi:hypothetical protein